MKKYILLFSLFILVQFIGYNRSLHSEPYRCVEIRTELEQLGQQLIIFVQQSEKLQKLVKTNPSPALYQAMNELNIRSRTLLSRNNTLMNELKKLGCYKE